VSPKIFGGLIGEHVRAFPVEEIKEKLRRRIKFMPRRSLLSTKTEIENARNYPGLPRRIGFMTLPKNLMDYSYDLIIEQLADGEEATGQ